MIMSPDLNPNELELLTKQEVEQLLKPSQAQRRPRMIANNQLALNTDRRRASAEKGHSDAK
jgi:hypothetical protein